MSHDDFNLNAYYDGELSPSESAAAQAHIESCPACQLELVKLAELSQHLRFSNEAPPRISQIEMARLKAAVLQQPVIQQTTLMHTARWLTRFAAALLIFSGAAAFFAMQGVSQASSTTWEQAAIRPASVLSDGTTSQSSLAEWIATDLSQSGENQSTKNQ